MNKEVRITVKAVRRKEPDLRRLARALLKQVMDQQIRENERTGMKPPMEEAS